MSSSIAIRCEGIAKRYRLAPQHYVTLRDSLSEWIQSPLRRVLGKSTRLHARAPDELWALQDVSFDVKRGEILGIIGRNGAGKSTLLKILSRITKPTSGQAEIHGRVGSLLEVGTGIHPELTGRENIYFNGAILGMSRREIDRKFEEIVAFSECARFLDTPVKRYSTGMRMRLAFSVAAHLETEILLVDEVLAVGDAGFQKKCIGKIDDAAHQGRTVLFVSHNLVAVEGLCTRAICLHEGRVVSDGLPRDVTSHYLQNWIAAKTDIVYNDIEGAPGNEMVRFRRACVRPLNGSPSEPITVRTPFVVEFDYWKLAPHIDLVMSASIYNQHGVHLFNTWKCCMSTGQPSLLRSSFIVPADLLNNGTHSIEFSAWLGETMLIFRWAPLLAFEVHDIASDLRGAYHGTWEGVVRPDLEWKTELIDAF
jgi:lipopolysaccharide transport system ATP-binding protein